MNGITNRAFAVGLGMGLLAALAASVGAEPDAPATQAGPPPAGQRAGGPPTPAEPVLLVEKFDANDDGWLNAAERAAAREYLAANPPAGPGRGRGGGRGNPLPPPEPGARLSAADVTAYPDRPFYDSGTLRTLFFDFENDDWEAELEAFYNTDVEVPAALRADGKAYRSVGVQFRGASSFFTVQRGYKRSLNVTVDLVDGDQNIGGYQTLNLLNSHVDPTFLRTVLYLQIAREYIPAPKANYVRVVINGENWGVFVSAQQFNSRLIDEWFGTTDGARWKVPGSPNGRGGLVYLGPDKAAYERIYEIRSRDNDRSWNALINLTKVLTETPIDRLEAALEPILNVDGVLRYLALEATFVNNDGYWTRASDYNLYLDRDGRFHVVPHDSNETFPAQAGRGGGPGGPRRGGQPPADAPPAGRAGLPPPGGPPGGPGGAAGGRGTVLEPLVSAGDEAKPLRSRLLAVPALRARYLAYMREMAERWLDWKNLEPLAAEYQDLIRADVARDTRKLYSMEQFTTAVNGETASLKWFADTRRAFLLGHADLARR